VLLLAPSLCRGRVTAIGIERYLIFLDWPEVEFQIRGRNLHPSEGVRMRRGISSLLRWLYDFRKYDVLVKASPSLVLTSFYVSPMV